jgi:hypothetical protein
LELELSLGRALLSLAMCLQAR